MLHRPFHFLLMVLTVLMVSAQMACAADDLVIKPGQGHSVRHADADHDHHDTEAPCQEACVTHHLVLLPTAVEPTLLAERGLTRASAPQAFSTRATAPPYAPPRSVIV